MRDIIAPFPALKVIFLKIFSAVFTYSRSANCKEVEYFLVWILWMNSLASGLRKGPTFSYTETAASLSLFDRYYFCRCSSEQAELVPFSYSHGKSIRCFNRLHDFSVTFPKTRIPVATMSFLAQRYLEFFACKILSFDV